MLFVNSFEKLGLGGYISLGVFALFAILQLIFAFLEKEKYRRIVKPFLLITLAVFDILVLPNHPLLYIAAFLDCIGDVLVLNRDKKTFIAGSACFFAGHLAYIFEVLWFVVGFENINYPFYIMIVVYALVMSFISWKFFFSKYAKKEAVAASIYFAGLTLLLPIFVMGTAKVQGLMWLSIIGSVFFIASDVIIMYSKYISKFKKSDFFIMIFYMIAQILITLGIVLAVIA